MQTSTVETPRPTSRSCLVALKSGLIHVVLAGTAFGVAAWLAVDTSGGRCSDVNSCLEVNLKLISFTLAGYALAYSMWGIALHRLLGSVSTNAGRRASSAAVFHLVLGATCVLGGIAAGGPWTFLSVIIAVVLLPAIAAWWAASRPETAEEYVPWWIRRGW